MILLLSQCHRIDTPVTPNPLTPGDGGGALTITVSNPSSTKASASEGDYLRHLVVYLINGTNQVSGVYDSGNSLINNSSNSASCTIEGIPIGSYKLYVVANKWASLPALSKGDTYNSSQLDDLTMAEISGGETPTFSDPSQFPYGMPSTAKIDNLIIVNGPNQVAVSLDRVVGRYSINVASNVQLYPVALKKVSLSNFNPSLSYFFGREDHSLPAGANYGPFANNLLTGTPNLLLNDNSRVVDIFLYEGAAPTYEITVEGAVFDEGVENIVCVPNTITTYTPNNIAAANREANVGYLICSSTNHTTNRVLGVVNGALVTTVLDLNSVTDQELAPYYWQFSSTGNTSSLMNTSTGRYLNISSSNNGAATLSTSPVTLAVSASGSGVRLKHNSSTRYLSLSNSPPTSSRSGVTLYLKTLTATTTEGGTRWLSNGNIVFPVLQFRKTLPITFLDKYMAPQPLNSIYRNQHLATTINLFYNDKFGTFHFEVSSWDERVEEISFN